MLSPAKFALPVTVVSIMSITCLATQCVALPTDRPVPAVQTIQDRSMTVRIRVLRLPPSTNVDMTKPLPPLTHATVRVIELGLSGTTDLNGEVSFSLPLGSVPWYGPNASVYTFDVSSPQERYRTTVRKLITPYEPQFMIPFSTIRNVFYDQTPE